MRSTVSRTVRGESPPATGKDIIALLKQDHKEVKGMFGEFEGPGPRANEQRRKLGTKICAALTAHSQIEKNILYPAFKSRAKDRDDIEQVLEAFEEHALVDGLVGEIQGMEPRDESYEAKVKTLMDLVLHHVKEEEGEMFPSARELFDKNELMAFGQEALQYKKT
jgi:hemerythrin superfamily protein